MNSLRVLVPEAQAMGSIACIRSLGRAGHGVVAVAEDPQALGFRSRYCAEAVLQPPGLSQPAYARWLRNLLDERRIDVIIPSESLVGMLGNAIGDFANWLPVGNDPLRLARFVSKFELFRCFLEHPDARLRSHLPPSRLLCAGDDLGSSLAGLRAPLFAKFDAVASAGLPARVIRYTTHAAAQVELPELLARYGRVLIQSFVAGRGVGVFALRWDGAIKASLMHRRLHEVPHDGGVSSFRETWEDAALHADAVARFEAMDWCGVGMLEYRYDDDTGRFSLMEFNARFWGSLHLALFAGVDFPRLLIEAKSGEPIVPVTAAVGVRCRYTFPKEVEYLWSLIRDPDVSGSRKASAAIEFVALALDPRVHSDLWYPGDRGLYWRALARTPGKFLHRN